MRDKLVTLEQAAKLVCTGDKVIMMGAWTIPQWLC